jgi:hypothetical protein
VSETALIADGDLSIAIRWTAIVDEARPTALPP